MYNRSMAKQTMQHWGFDTKTIDKTVRPQDDFYLYANGNWLKKNKIPDTEARWGSFIALRYETEHQLKAIVEDLTEKKTHKKGSSEQLVADLFRSGMDLKTREKLGLTPIAALRKEVADIASTKDLLHTLAHFQYIGIGVPWGLFVDQDSKNSKQYALHFFQSGLGMPDRDYYLKEEPEFLRVKEAYARHLLTIFKLLGYSHEEAEQKAAVVLAIEKKLAEASMDKVDTRDSEKIYHKKTFKELQKEIPSIDWKAYFATAHIPLRPYYIVCQPNFIKAAEKLINTLSLEEWKIYLEWHLTDDAAPFLTKAFTQANFEYYSKTLSGTKKMKPDWRRILSVVNGTLGHALGQLYVKKHFPPGAKKKMNALIDDLFIAYKERIKKLDWMTPTTKKKAVSKLSKISRKVGYPDKWNIYKGLTIGSNNYFENILRAAEYEHQRQMNKLGKTIDREEWFASPQIVNAWFSPSMNEILFPAAILQAPIFDFTGDDAVNYGAIGSIIGHELTHAFDDQGAKFDGAGNLNDWWTAQDKKQFEQKGEMLAKQYDSYKVADDVAVNGKLTLGENIADLGGLVIAWDAYQTHLKKTGRKDINGFTPEQRFFFGFAQQERELSRPEFAKTQVLTDPHSPAEFRINGPLANFEPFYKVFNVQPGDKLYREPKLRSKIW